MAQSIQPDPWICEVCDQPIIWTGPGGEILLDDCRSREMPGYDPDAPEQTVALGDRGEILAMETAELQVEAGLRMLDDPGVRFHVWHFDCAPPDRRFTYAIDCGRARRIEQWVAWTTHLLEKEWMKRRDFVAMARFWCHGHRLPIRDDML